MIFDIEAAIFFSFTYYKEVYDFYYSYPDTSMAAHVHSYYLPSPTIQFARGCYYVSPITLDNTKTG